MLLRRSVLALTLAFLLATASSASALPVDEPIQYPDIEMDDNLMDPLPPQPTVKPANTSVNASGGVLEMDGTAIGQDEVVQPKEGDQLVVQPSIGGLSGNRMSIKGMNSITFETPMSEGVVDFTNPEDSTVNLQYLIRIPVAELLRTLGRTGYTEAEYAQLSAREGFNPETEYIVLAQTKGVPPGKRVHTILLGSLPDGTTLGVGTYKGQTIITAYDLSTNERSMVGASMEANITVKTDEVSLAVRGNRCAISLFTPSSEASEIRYELVIDKAELVGRVPQDVTDAMQDAYYSLAELGSVKPGDFLETEAALNTLPGGTALPAGGYEAWIIRYALDAQTGQWNNKMTSTMVHLVVSP